MICLVLLTSRMEPGLDAHVIPRFWRLCHNLQDHLYGQYFFITLQAATIAMAGMVRVQYLWVYAFGCHWFTTEIAILHAYRPVGAGLIT
jgi:hypothetical protein